LIFLCDRRPVTGEVQLRERGRGGKQEGEASGAKEVVHNAFRFWHSQRYYELRCCNGRMRNLILLGALAGVAFSQDLTPGQIVDSVKCLADASESYTLYLPSNYSATKSWNVILAFDAGGRGRRGVERYQAAAEKYGYIVAGSNNSRNGPWEVSMHAAQAMSADVHKRFNVNSKRVYTAGMSGGARVAMKVALEWPGQIAGVMPSSAGFPSDTVASLAFSVFGTAGTEDFNNVEMRDLDRDVKTPHRVVIFEGGHQWLSSDLAMQAVEWMELQAMKTGRRPRDKELVNQILAARVADADSQKDHFQSWLILSHLAEDFKGLADVSKYTARANVLGRQRDVLDAQEQDRADVQREIKINQEIMSLEIGLDGDKVARAAALLHLETRLTELAKQANAPEDSPTRRLARRVVNGISASGRAGDDPAYEQIIRQIRPPGARGGDNK
jgi:poly(3-hydroxybutyrate) depolymerase